MTAQDDALAVARFLRPRKNPARPGSEYARQEDETDRNWIWNNIAAAEAVLVERGLGVELVRALAQEVGADWMQDPTSEINLALPWTHLAQVAFAPLDARLRAMAAVVRKQQEKEA